MTMKKDTTRQPKVTDHAVIRYMDRVMGIDVEAVRREIGARVAAGVQLKASAVVADGMRFVLADEHVTTVRPCHSDPHRPRLMFEEEGE